MIVRDEFLWVQKYRPQEVSELILSEDIKETLTAFVKKGDLPNFLFHSQSGGTGKTSAAMAIAAQLNLETMLINASEERGIDTIRTKMTDFCSAMSMDGRRKMLILDEADHLTDISQNALRNFFEKFSSNCCFVMTANQAQKIIPPLQSRCAVIEFRFPKDEKPKLALNFFQKLCTILDREGINYEKNHVLESKGIKHERNNTPETTINGITYVMNDTTLELGKYDWSLLSRKTLNGLDKDAWRQMTIYKQLCERTAKKQKPEDVAMKLCPCVPPDLRKYCL